MYSVCYPWYNKCDLRYAHFIFEKVIQGFCVCNEQSFSVTNIIIWCKGRVLIDNNDVAPSCPLKISASGENKILNCQIAAVNEPANNFQLSATHLR